jgi:hypothetical protein
LTGSANQPPGATTEYPRAGLSHPIKEIFMSSHDPQTPSSGARPVDEPAAGAGESLAVPGAAATGRSSLRSLWICTLAAGIVAGLSSWIAGEEARRYVDPTPLSKEVFPGPATARLLATATSRSGMLAYGFQGTILGLCLGLTGGFLRRSSAAAIIAGAGGAAAAGAAGAFAAKFLIPVFYRNVDDGAVDLILPLLIHGGLWTSIGAVAGIAFGVGLGGRGAIGRSLLGGLLGAVVGTLVYEVAGAFFFPLAHTGRPLSLSWGARLLAHVVVALSVAVCIAAAACELISKTSTLKRA